MKDVLRKAILLGLGAGALTKETAEKAYKELKKSKLTPAEGKKFIAQLLKETEKERKHFQQLAERELRRVAKKSGLTAKNIRAAQAVLGRLEKMVAAKTATRKKKR